MQRMHWLLVLSIGACSPYEYSREVTGFSVGVDRLAAAFDAGYANLAADREAVLIQEQLDTRARIVLPPSCARPVGISPGSRAPCTLLAAGQTGPSITFVQQTQTRAKDALKVLSGYANGLAAVTNAADRTAYNAAAKRLEASVGNLAKFADPAAPGIGTIAPFVVNVFTWAVGEALDQDRFDALRRAVIFAQEPVRTVGEALKPGLQAIAENRIFVLDHGARALAAGLGPALSPAAYKERRGQTQAMYATLARIIHQVA